MKTVAGIPTQKLTPETSLVGFDVIISVVGIYHQFITIFFLFFLAHVLTNVRPRRMD